MKKLFIVGLYNSFNESWEFCGVFDNTQQALKKCTGSDYFIGEAHLNDENIPEYKEDWKHLFYPKSQEIPEWFK
jgi:hypothetical protein